MRFTHLIALAIASYAAGLFLPERFGAPIYFIAVAVGTVWIVVRRWGRPQLVSPYRFCGQCRQPRSFVNRVLHGDAFCSSRCQREMALMLEGRAIGAIRGEQLNGAPSPTLPRAYCLWRQVLREGGYDLSSTRHAEMLRGRARKEALGIPLPSEYRGQAAGGAR